MNRSIHWSEKEVVIGTDLFYDAESLQPPLVYRLCPVVRGLYVDFYFHRLASVIELPSVWRLHYYRHNLIASIIARSETAGVLSEIGVFNRSPIGSAP